jgi:cellulose synthase/poly-beta-1,6-N-acetylglucosamine synthase-like glycosyltransferase
MLTTILSLTIISLILLFTLRRLLFTSTLLAPFPLFSPVPLFPVLLLIPARNESTTLPQTFSSLDALDYPKELLQIVLINDGSTDDTLSIMTQAASSQNNWRVLNLEKNVGKAQALNLALQKYNFGEIVYIFDADHRPQKDCLRLAVSAFNDPKVAGVSGRTISSNALQSPSAYYSTIESLVHQLITMRGKDILHLGPALLGSNNGYRRAALDQVGGFRAGAFLEDSDLTLTLHRAGYITRFVPNAISFHQAPFTLRGFIRQHLRWGRGFNDVARTHLFDLLRDSRLSLLMRFELALFSLGYLDRLALLLALALIVFSTDLRPLLIGGISVSLALPFIQIIAVLVYDRASLAMWIRLPLVIPFFFLDIAIAVSAMAITLINRPRAWHPTERA